MKTKKSKIGHYLWGILLSATALTFLFIAFTPPEVVQKREQIELETAELKQLRDLFPLGGNIPFDKYDLVGHPETLLGTDNIYWIAYFPKADLTVWSKKRENNLIVFRRKGRLLRRGFKD